MEKPERRDYSTISPSAKALLLLKARTDLPYARRAAELLFGKAAVDAARAETATLSEGEARLRHFESRARSIDLALAALSLTRVVEIASGLSFRGLAMAERAGVFYLDTDLPEMAAMKAELVERLRPAALAGTYRVQPLDAVDEEAFAATLRDVPEGPLAVVEEGLLMYLGPAEKARLAGSIRRALRERGGAWVMGDVYVRLPAEYEPHRDARTIAFLERHRVEENKFADWAAAAQFFEGEGFVVASKSSGVEDGASHTRETWVLTVA